MGEFEATAAIAWQNGFACRPQHDLRETAFDRVAQIAMTAPNMDGDAGLHFVLGNAHRRRYIGRETLEHSSFLGQSVVLSQ